MRIQDIYIIGVAMQARLYSKKIHFAMSRNDKQEFDRIWKESIEEIKTMVLNKDIDLFSPDECIAEINWDYRQEADFEEGGMVEWLNETLKD